MPSKVPAVVVGAGVNGLGVARSLAHEGVPVWLLDCDLQRPEMHTRAANPLKIRALHGDILIADLVRLASKYFIAVRPVLFLTQEESVKTLSHQREQLSVLYRFSLPPQNIVATLLHKQGFQKLAETLSAPIPPLVHIRTLTDLPALQQLRYPIVIKPGERHAEYGRQFKKAYRVDSAAEASELLRRILPVMPDVVAQEWIEGSDANIYFCLQYLNRHSEVIAQFTGRKLRSWPPQVGGTASCMPAPEVQDELSDMTTRFFQATEVIGMAGMEYKRDVRHGEFRMVEPTIGRTDYQEEVATLNGYNLPFAAYRTELGLAIPVAQPLRRRIAWRVRGDDIQSAQAQNQRRSAGFAQVDRVVDAWWRWSDPMPSLLQLLRRIRWGLYRRIMGIRPASQMAKCKS